MDLKEIRSNPDSRIKIENLTRQTQLASNAEVAGHGPARRKGLLGRTDLPPGGGLWIVPCESVHTWFMKFPIDLVYIDRNLVVKKVRSSVGPWRMSACLSAHSIIELPAGVILSTHVAPGDHLEFALAESSTQSTSESSREENCTPAKSSSAVGRQP